MKKTIMLLLTMLAGIAASVGQSDGIQDSVTYHITLRGGAYATMRVPLEGVDTELFINGQKQPGDVSETLGNTPLGEVLTISMDASSARIDIQTLEGSKRAIKKYLRHTNTGAPYERWVGIFVDDRPASFGDLRTCIEQRQIRTLVLTRDTALVRGRYMCQDKEMVLDIHTLASPPTQPQGYIEANIRAVPRFRNGDLKEFHKWLTENVDTQSIRVYRRGEVTVRASFTILEDGSVKVTDVEGDAPAGYKAEVVRVIESTSGVWTPEITNGAPSKSEYHIPFIINISERKSK